MRRYIMLRSGILNPQIRSLLARIRHTNTLVIADRGFPFWPQVETIDLSLTDDIPTVLQVLEAVRSEWHFGSAWMAQEFLVHNASREQQFLKALGGAIHFEPHTALKARVPAAIGLIRTADTTQYANVILESA